MTETEALELLRRFNEWRRWDKDAPGPIMPAPREIGEAIDVACRALAEHDAAMMVLRQIATGDNRTRRKNLARSFIGLVDGLVDSMRAEA